MRIELQADGCLQIIVETTVEEFAMQHWMDCHEDWLAGKEGKISIQLVKERNDG